MDRGTKLTSSPQPLSSAETPNAASVPHRQNDSSFSSSLDCLKFWRADFQLTIKTRASCSGEKCGAPAWCIDGRIAAHEAANCTHRCWLADRSGPLTLRSSPSAEKPVQVVTIKCVIVALSYAALELWTALAARTGAASSDLSPCVWRVPGGRHFAEDATAVDTGTRRSSEEASRKIDARFPLGRPCG
jgi:hypothetical protein